MEQHRSAKHVRNSNLPKNQYSPQQKLQSSGVHRIIFKIQKESKGQTIKEIIHNRR